MRTPRTPRIRRWLLVEGYKNTVMNEYTAVLCAGVGDLRGELLEKEPPGEDVVAAAGSLISAMIAGGPAEDIDDYEDGAAVMARYLDLMSSRAETLRQFLRVDFLRAFLAENEEDWADREARGWWAPELRQRLLDQCAGILARPHWRGQILEGLDSSERETRMQAAAAAEALGMDVWERTEGLRDRRAAVPPRRRTDEFHLLPDPASTRAAKFLPTATQGSRASLW